VAFSSDWPFLPDPYWPFLSDPRVAFFTRPEQYAGKMGEKYLKRYRKYFRDPDIREFNMQHEQWLFGGEQYALPVLKAIDEFMNMPV
jgi:hypothetical protein